MRTRWGSSPPPAALWPWIWILYIILVMSPLTAPQKTLGETRGEAVTAQWLLNGRTRRSLDAPDKVPPAQGEILVTAEGRHLILEVERNHLLLSPGFTETHYTEAGEMVTLTPNQTEHCYYHGRVKGHDSSSVALSTCSGISGLIVLSANDSFYLHPLAGPGSRNHMLYQTKHLPIEGGSCGHEEHSSAATSHLGDFISQPGHHRMKRNVWGAQKYMELYIVADYSLFIKQNKNLGQTKHRIMEIANFVDKFYMSMNIKIALIGLEVWTVENQCDIQDDANHSLKNFLAWKQKLRTRKKHDNAQLITGVTFKGTTIGMAPVEGMCSADNSGGVSMDHAELAIGAAATMAHEIGHNFGMSHDKDSCCVEDTSKQGGCIMAAATGYPFPRKFSSCSQQQLRSYFQKGGGMCLFNMPNTKDLVMGKKCGNGFLEEGEQCDCGEPEECTNPCCNANDCTLKEGAECAHGDCCQDCKLKAGGTLCREKSGACDLPEFCRGDNAYCPGNVYMLDGTPCAYGEAYCMNGMCLTHGQQCLHLWGSGARPAPDICFINVNMAGNKHGNCGKDGSGQFVKCKFKDAKCGKIQCQSSAERPKDDNTVSVDTTIQFNGHEVKCRGTYSYSVQDDESDSSDPGIVMTGTKCGDGMVCKDRQCQNASFFEWDECIARCNGHGVCNSNRNCHCNAGWGPPYCKTSGHGGSIDSGPVPDDFEDGLIVFLLLLFLVVLPLIGFGIYYWYRRPDSQLKKWVYKNRAKCRMGNSLRHPACRGHSKSIFTQRSFPPPAASPAIQKSSWSTFHGKNGASQVNTQPINIVRPMLTPISQPPNTIIQLKPSRPPPPVKSSPIIPTKQESQKTKLLPPKKPLPTSPIRTPQLNPPRKPLPLNPIQKEGLLVKTPSANAKPPVINSAMQIKAPSRPKPGSRVQATVAAFLQKQ
ncbi:disintegrin and metalloproteinase domain-containing protein 33-like [Bufo gargarizans]|uniref:disintegrin and metalloproteinase domain-containing protein 33-like n=1 Tax=Bufo gargarizans TaxID=30331 RepID=UPI001CF31B6A|nr:disintegrin and metalloproteinase domain-containing protein 33-like [Bufo gargarizans]